jgi:hypothetical protein
MIVKAWKVGVKWTATIEDDNGTVLVGPIKEEKRVGCAIRTALNIFQMRFYGPDFEEIKFSIDDW